MKKLFFGLMLCLCLMLCAMAGADVTLQGVTVPENAELVDFGEEKVASLDALISFLHQLPNVRQVNMFANRMTKKDCDRLAQEFPQIRWGWTMVLSRSDHKHLIRTDATAFSTLHNNKSSTHKSDDFTILKYCWNLKALDIGHNTVTSLDFLYDLPELRVLIVACNNVRDITPIASLKKLEYLEIFKNRISDLSPLAELPHILDLNICFNEVSDWTPLLGLKTLKRLWIYRSCWYDTYKDVPAATVQMLKQALPDTEVDAKHYSTAGTWRYISKSKMHPHYKVITQIFGENHLKPGSGYVPFEDSFPDEDEPSAVPAPSATQEPTGTPVPTEPEAQPEDDAAAPEPMEADQAAAPEEDAEEQNNVQPSHVVTVTLSK